MRYRVDGRTIIVEPDTPYLKTYKVNYVNMTRDTSSTISVSGQVGSDRRARKPAAPRRLRSRPRSRPTSGKCCARTSTASSPPAASWISRRQSGRLARSAPRLRASSSWPRPRRWRAPAPTPPTCSRRCSAAKRCDDKAQEIVINPIAGTVTVLATERQHNLVQQYLDSRAELGAAPGADRSDHRRGAAVPRPIRRGSTGSSSRTTETGSGSSSKLIDPRPLATPPRVVIGYGAIAADFNISIRLLEQFGNTRVLSSPKLMALNNQTALLKVVDNVVYFTVQSPDQPGARPACNRSSRSRRRRTPSRWVSSSA